jgi:hypothetical protein
MLSALLLVAFKPCHSFAITWHLLMSDMVDSACKHSSASATAQIGRQEALMVA